MNAWLNDTIHGYDPWEPMGGTMGSRGGYHGCPMGRIPKPPGPQGTLGPLGSMDLIGPEGLMAPQGTQGSGSMAWIWFFHGCRRCQGAPGWI